MRNLRPDSLQRPWCNINPLLTYLLIGLCVKNVQVNILKTLKSIRTWQEFKKIPQQRKTLRIRFLSYLPCYQ